MTMLTEFDLQQLLSKLLSDKVVKNNDDLWICIQCDETYPIQEDCSCMRDD